MTNWYVIQVRNGHEKEIAKKCRILISKNVLLEAFIPEYVVRKRFHGKWNDVRCILFKGYVFLISDDIDELFNQLKLIPDLTKMIGKKKDVIYSLKKEEVEFLKSFEDINHIVEMSMGFIKNDRIYISKGPLQGKEGMIKKIDRHKRVAYLSINMFDEEMIAKVGLEIISKD